MYLVRIVERMSDNHIFLSSAGIAFNTLLCFVPLTLVLFYVLGLYLDSESALATIYAYIEGLNLFPFQREMLKDVVDNVVHEFVSGSGIAGLVGIIGLIYTSSALFAAIRTVLNNIFHIPDTKNVVVSKLKDFALLSIVGIMLLLINAALITMSVMLGATSSLFGWTPDSFVLRNLISNALTFVISYIGFYVMFYIIPDKRLPAKAIVLSSTVAALLWALARVGFEFYISRLWTIGKVYGSYSILVAAAIWIYYSGLTLLFSAEIGQMYIERRKLRNLFTEKALLEVQRAIHRTNLFPAENKDTPDTRGSG